MRVPIRFPEEFVPTGSNTKVELTTIIFAEWHVVLNNPVAAGDLIATVSNNKGDFDLEAPASGMLAEICVQEGDNIAPEAVKDIVLGYIETGT